MTYRGFRSPEAALLLGLSRRAVAPDRRDSLVELAGRVRDWESLVTEAERHGLAPLISRQLASLDGAVPQHVVERCAGYARTVAVRNLAMTRELLRVLALLRAQGIPTLTLKGPALAVLAYGDVSLREYSDLDVLVRRGDVAQARRTLEKAGYALAASSSPEQRAAEMDFDYHVQMKNAATDIALELHWGITKKSYGVAADATWWWTEQRAVQTGRDAIVTLSPEAQLLYLCIHSSKHGWFSLGWMCDVAEVVRSSPSLDWERVTGRAVRTGTWRMLGVGLELARSLFEAPLPLAVTDRLSSDRVVLELARDVERRLSLAAGQEEPKGGGLRFHARLRERFRDRLRYYFLVGTTPTRADLSLVQIAGGWHVLYYVLRPVRLAAKWGRWLRFRGGWGKPPRKEI